MLKASVRGRDVGRQEARHQGARESKEKTRRDGCWRGKDLGARVWCVGRGLALPRSRPSHAAAMQAENAHNTRDWTTGMVSFDRILANLKEVTASRPAAEAASASSSDEEQDDRPQIKKSKSSTKKKVRL